MKQLKKDVKEMKDNHLVHIEEDVRTLTGEMKKISECVAIHGTDIKWLKENHRFVKYVVLGALVTGVIGIILDLIIKFN
jgi:hypothetical protein